MSLQQISAELSAIATALERGVGHANYSEAIHLARRLRELCAELARRA